MGGNDRNKETGVNIDSGKDTHIVGDAVGRDKVQNTIIQAASDRLGILVVATLGIVALVVILILASQSSLSSHEFDGFGPPPPTSISRVKVTNNPGVEAPTAPPASSPQTPRVVLGPWSSKIDGIELIVDKVEILRLAGARKYLRVYMTVDNQTDGTIDLPLFMNFSAIDNDGASYEADAFVSQWPIKFLPRKRVSGSVDLSTSVNEGATSLSIGFSKIFGLQSFGNNSITVDGVKVP